MLALYRSGRQADALETFQEARRVLADELGLEPGPGAATAAGGDPRARPGDRRRSRRPPAPRQPARAVDLVRRPRGRARPRRRAAARAPPRHAHGPARRGEEQARGRGGALARRASSRTASGSSTSRARAATADAVRLLANAVDVRGVRAARARHARAFATRTRSLVLDACEHVLDEAARIASTLLAECPRLRVLATSREALHVAGRGARPRRDRSELAAVELFLERARAARPGFEPDAEDVALVGRDRRRVDGLPLAIELAAARVNVLGLAELVSHPRAPRLAAARQPGVRPGPHRAASARRMELRPPARGREDAAAAARRPPRRRVARVARRGRSDARPRTRRPSRISSPRSSTSRSCRLVRGRRRALRHARHRPRVRARAARRERRARRRPRAPTPSTSRRWPTRRASSCAGREWLRWERRLELENDNFWAALAYARDAPDPAVAGPARDARVVLRAGRARLRGTALPRAGAVCRRATRRRSSCGSSCSPTSATSRPKSSISSVALAAGERALALAETAGAPWELAFARLMLSLAVAQSGDVERAAALARRRGRRVRGGCRRLGHRSDGCHPRDRCGARAATSLRSPRWRRRPAVTRMRSATTRFACRRCCSRRGSRSDEASVRPLSRPTGVRSSSPGASGSATTPRSRSPASGRTRSPTATSARRRSSSGRRLPPPRLPRRQGVAAHARVELGAHRRGGR